ncbi:hypothetical protein [Aureimonas sp. D3]|uniref:hypothetical protein n=1 Tax=Aureimonas sp. D3 TaxID=1638164 RepID=UPI0007824BDC|nr:hypothetical protein [Aureimonas sp. D3]
MSFYSLRHNFRSALRNARVPDLTADRVMGHIIPGAQGHYGDPHLEPAEIEDVRRITFPGVDITPYLDPSAIRRPIRRKKVSTVPLADGE